VEPGTTLASQLVAPTTANGVGAGDGVHDAVGDGAGHAVALGVTEATGADGPALAGAGGGAGDPEAGVVAPQAAAIEAANEAASSKLAARRMRPKPVADFKMVDSVVSTGPAGRMSAPHRARGTSSGAAWPLYFPRADRITGYRRHGRGPPPGRSMVEETGKLETQAGEGASVERIGFVGLGTMGASMAANLARAGAPLTVWNRTPGRAAALLELGAREAASPAELAAATDVVVVCVSDGPDVASVLFGPDGVADGAASGSLVIDCSTISATATRQFGRRLAERGVGMVDAPVSGGSEGARLGTLTIFVGGSDSDFARARPVLAALGRTITHLGPLGNGQAAKAVNQVIVAGAYLGVAEGIVLGIRAGLDPGPLVEALSGGSAQSWVLANRSARMIADEYPLGFRLALHRKDLGIAIEMAGETGVMLPTAMLAAALEDRLLDGGHGEEDMSVLARAIRELSEPAAGPEAGGD
jgi:3-hydroxyisobutyrate dehydrogenase